MNTQPLELSPQLRALLTTLANERGMSEPALILRALHCFLSAHPEAWTMLVRQAYDELAGGK